MVTTRRRLRKRWLWLLAPLLLAAGFLLYVSIYYHADETARTALESDGAVTISRTDYGWRFDGPAEEDALIFYPGAKVEEIAYAPLLHRIAAEGMDVCLVEMPFRLAVLAPNRADRVMETEEYANWYIGGHSLGGVMAVSYAANHDLRGIVLLASYPTKAVDEPLLLLYGTEDGVLNRERVAEASHYGSVETRVIEGGNHASFGDYGPQAGDGEAALSAEEQQRRAAAFILQCVG